MSKHFRASRGRRGAAGALFGAQAEGVGADRKILSDRAHNDCGRLEPRPDKAADQQTDERHYGLEKIEGRRRAKRAHAAQPEQHSDGESVEPERDDKNGDLENTASPSEGPLQSRRTLTLSRYRRRSRSCRAAGAAIGPIYRIELQRLPPPLRSVKIDASPRRSGATAT